MTVRQRAQRIRTDREAGRGVWRWIQELFGLAFNDAVEDATARRLEEEAESRARANWAFDRHGPSERDLLPGGRAEQMRRRRRRR